MIQKITPWFIHKRKLASVISELPPELLDYPERSITIGDVRLADFVFDWTQTNKVEPLGVLLAEDRLAVGSLFTIYRDFYARPVRRSRNRELHIKLDHGARLIMELTPDHYTSTSALVRLSGHPANLFVLAYVMDVTSDTLVAAPLLIADLLEGSQSYVHPIRFEVPVYSIDNFKKVTWSSSPISLKQLEALRFIPEHTVKELFATILGESMVPSDWGGEMNDLFTTRISIHGEYVATAIAFKGPAVFRELTPALMGKNGDQIGRLFNSEGDLCIVQHCHRVHASVRRQMRDYASRTYAPKQFCVIDGFQTYDILRHFAPEYF